jgi:hypothetical protein
VGIWAVPPTEGVKVIDTQGKQQPIDVAAGVVPVSNASITDTLSGILVELMLISQLLADGLNIPDDLNDMRDEITQEIET